MVPSDLKSLGRLVRRNVKRWLESGSVVPERPTFFSAPNPETMRGACAIASFSLHRILDSQGVDNELAMWQWHNECHCWVEHNGLAIDLTATQFNTGQRRSLHPQVLVTTRNRYNVVDFSEGKLITGSDAIYDIKHRWTATQNPFRYLDKIEALVRRVNRQHRT